MFDKIYRKVAHFGIWADEQADQMGKQDALDIIKSALNRGYEEDVRSPEVFRALEYLQSTNTRIAPYINFRKGMAIENPEERLQALTKAYQSMV